ncbi:metal-dependent hydrolase [Paenibacillus sp. R14(2021)]|uniref:metal-dependent hydrolase n=1 Tax=Paenibacillus sp. R14(2021) TaxID=2859228 RepID=UPI001C6148A7|nr:metal-dependent hydrolase [Paenibacillus sp. R14(2021)]
MKGTTHLAIGVAIGVTAAISHPFSAQHAAIYIAVAACSALSADLDGTNMLSGKLSGIARMIRELLLWGGLILTGILGYIYVMKGMLYTEWSIGAVAMSLLGFVSRSGVIRNALVSAIGSALLYGGIAGGMGWLMGLGVYVAWVPWLNHRGLTHTVWATAAWGSIGWGLEQQVHVDGVASVAVWGYVSHLVADTLTPSGVKWLYPLSKKTFKLPIGKL